MWIYGGVPKAIEVTTHVLDDVFAGLITIDGSSIYGMTDVHNSDLLLVPDLNSFRILPICNSEIGNVAVFMCFVCNPDGTPAKGCTRSILKRELDVLGKCGFDKMNVGFEPEFFLLRDGKILDDESYADITEVDRILREMMFEFERVGIIPLTCHHERAPSQFEITFKYEDAMRSCDNLVLYKMIAKHVACKNGLDLIFDPKPFESVNGSGCHTNISLAKNGKNAFAKDDGLSDIAMCFISGILENAGAITWLANSSEDSYKRLVPNAEAPTKICWGYHNRSAMIRIPKASENATRVELRSPDMMMNPYLCVAGILRVGLDDVKRMALPPKPIGDVSDNDEIKHLPASLEDAMREFKASELFRGFL